ncbi:hypothetical protein SASPL_111197 [Salvia splendens]|uniref:GST C-terminal domain-containing protein n=1 Tax=Salvia splendens TaxID=180675 RepID=A0A8X9A3E4_SALSN|nr:hypothetical protein SASPL_111197 [Salvia splendens]
MVAPRIINRMSRSTFLGSPTLLPPPSTAADGKCRAPKTHHDRDKTPVWPIPPPKPPGVHRPVHLVRRLAPHDVPARPLRLHPALLPLPPHHHHHHPPLPPPLCRPPLPLGPPHPHRPRPQGPPLRRPLSVASPAADGIWEFRPFAANTNTSVMAPGLDEANGCRTMRESYDIIQFFNSGLNDVATNPELDLAPPPLKKEIDRWNKIIYPNINSGVYRCGFAQSQEVYDSAANELFSTMEMVEEHLGGNRYLCGDTLTLADVCLFTTLVRFDLIYNVLFKCTKKKLLEYQNLHGYTRDIYQISGVAETCNFGAIMDGYYKTLFPLNPSNIRPAIPAACEREALARPHNRDLLSLNAVV